MTSPPSSQNDPLLNQLADEFTERYRRGGRPTLEDYVEQHPELADDIRELFPILIQIEKAKIEERPQSEKSGSEVHHPERIGDFRIVREIGRGGMGIVYEAEQISLGRQVALKILPQKMLLGRKLKLRFEREVKAVARLHHTNIVPIFVVGEEHNIPYYAMQLVPGLGLNEVLKELPFLHQKSRHEQLPPADPKQRHHSLSAAFLAHSLFIWSFERSVRYDSVDGSDYGCNAQKTGKDTTSTQNDPMQGHIGVDGPVTEHSPTFSVAQTIPVKLSRSKKHTFWQNVTSIGKQAAEALAYAHRHGVLHRDVKPSNLLLDMNGRVWLTDFGLAKVDDQQNLTLTGDIVGTLRYLPPEAFDGRNDARSDVYSLGLTLYEMLAGQPAHSSEDKNALMKQVTHGEPKRLRQLNSQIPVELETIVHKAIDREPDKRYQSADALAEDLGRFMRDEPIQARKMSFVGHIMRWARRNKRVAGLTAAMVLILVLGTFTSVWQAIRAAVAEDLAHNNASLVNQRNKQLEESLVQVNLAKKESEKQEQIAKIRLYGALIRNAKGELDAYNAPRAWRYLQATPEDLRGWEYDFLVSRIHSGHQSLVGHRSPVSTVAVSSSGKLLASGDEYRKVRLWDFESGKQLHDPLTGHTGPLLDIAFSPDEKQLLTLSLDGTIRLWDTKMGQLLHLLNGSVFSAAAFSPNGKRIIAGNVRGEIWMFNSRTGKTVDSYSVHQGRILALACHPNGRRVVTSAWDDRVKISDVKSKKVVRILKEHKEWVRTVAVSPDGKYIATGSDDKSIQIWNQEGEFVTSLTGHTGPIQSVCFSINGQKLISASRDGTLRIWDIEERLEASVLLGHFGPVRDVTCVAGGEWMVSGGDDRTIRRWSIAQSSRNPIIEKRHDRFVSSLAFSHDGSWLASGDRSGDLILSDVESGRILFEKSMRSKAMMPDITSLRFTDSQQMFVGDPQGRLSIVSWHSPNHRSHKFHWKTVPVHGTGSGVVLALHKKNNLVASGGEDGTVVVYDTKDYSRRTTLSDYSSRVRAMSFNPEGTKLAVGGRDGAFVIFDLNTTKVIARSAHDPDGELTVLDYSPIANRMGTGGEDGNIKVWDSTKWEVVWETGVSTEVGRVRHLEFTPDGKRIVSCASDGKVRLWHSENGEPLLNLDHPDIAIGASVSLTSDGTRIASGGFRGSVVIWDRRSPRTRTNHKSHWKDAHVSKFVPIPHQAEILKTIQRTKEQYRSSQTDKKLTFDASSENPADHHSPTWKLWNLYTLTGDLLAAEFYARKTQELSRTTLRHGRHAEGIKLLQQRLRAQLKTIHRTAKWVGNRKRAQLLLAALSETPPNSLGSTPTAKNPSVGYFFTGNSYFVIPSLHFDGQPPWTLEAIVTPSKRSLAPWTTVVGDVQGGGFALEIMTNRWVAEVHTGVYDFQTMESYSQVVDKQPIRPHQKYHLAAVWDGTMLRLFVDGQQRSSKPVTRCTRLSGYPIMIGTDPGGRTVVDGLFNGTIYEVRISRGVVYKQPFRPPSTLSKRIDTEALYVLNPIRGKWLLDRSGHGHHAIHVLTD